MLTLARLREVNLSRCKRWHPLEAWSESDWLTAVVGELGEAANIIKKRNRSRDGLGHNKETDEELRVMLEDEIGDTLNYLDLLAARVGVDLEEVSRRVFNRKSEEWNFPERL